MPYVMGCCCVSMCAARNIVRYQYRIGGNECVDDYCIPWLLSGAAYCALFYTPCCICCFLPVIVGLYSYFIAVIMKLLLETKSQLQARGGVPGYYLSSPPILSHGVVATAPPGMYVYQPQSIPVAVANEGYMPTAYHARVVPSGDFVTAHQDIAVMKNYIQS